MHILILAIYLQYRNFLNNLLSANQRKTKFLVALKNYISAYKGCSFHKWFFDYESIWRPLYFIHKLIERSKGHKKKQKKLNLKEKAERCSQGVRRLWRDGRSIGGKKEEDETSLLLDSGDSRTKLRISSFVGKVPARRIRPAGKNRVAGRTEGREGMTEGRVGVNSIRALIKNTYQVRVFREYDENGGKVG